MPLTFAIIGCGRISKRHCDLLASGEISDAKLIGVCDINQTLAKTTGEKYKVDYFTNMHDMVEKVKPDVLCVLTESGNHAKNVLELLKYKKHFIVEKPISLSLKDADAMIEGCDKAGVKLFVVKQNRFNLPILQLRKALEAGKFGKLVMGSVRVRWCRPQKYYDQAPWRGTWAMDGGVLTNQAIHHVDMLQWMMGSVESVFAYSSTRLVNIEAEDTAVVSLKFANGALGTIEATTATRPTDLEGSISILGEYGSVEVAGFAMNKITTWKFHDSNLSDSEIAKYSVNPPNVYGYGHKLYYQHVVNSLVDSSSRLIDGLEARKSLEIVNAIYESIETQLPISLRYTPRFSRLGNAK